MALLLPLITQLPEVISTGGWDWKLFSLPRHSSKNFWMGTDPDGNRWLAKMRGSFRGYRELVFARIAQRLGWSCQSSVFAILDSEDPPLQANPENEAIQLVSWFYEEHNSKIECLNCPLVNIAGSISEDYLLTLKSSNIRSILDWPRCEIAAAIFGTTCEGGERLFTKDHQLVMIDFEYLFCSIPEDLRDNPWYNSGIKGRELTIEVCTAIGALRDHELKEFLRIPSGLTIVPYGDLTVDGVRKSLYAGRDYAMKFLSIEIKG